MISRLFLSISHMTKAPNNKFAVFLLAFIIVSFLQFNWKDIFGWSPEFAMAFLVVCGFYLNIGETAVICAIGVLLFNWLPLPGSEILFYFLIPLIIIYVRKMFPWQSGFINFLGTILAVAVFYSVSDFPAVAANLPFFAMIVFTTAVFGAVIFYLFDYFYKMPSI